MGSATVYADKDTSIRWTTPTTNYGGGTRISLRTATDVNGGDLVGIYGFTLPAGDNVIKTATLRLYYGAWEVNDPVGRTVTMIRVRRADWVEMEATWNIYKTGSNWGTAGCLNTTTDIDTSLTTSLVIPSSYGWMEWDILAIAQDAIASRDRKVLVKMKDTSPDAVNFISHFWAREAEEDEKPEIVVEYEEAGGGGSGPASSLLAQGQI